MNNLFLSLLDRVGAKVDAIGGGCAGLRREAALATNDGLDVQEFDPRWRMFCSSRLHHRASRGIVLHV